MKSYRSKGNEISVDLNFLLEKKPDFYELTQKEQIKYICFIYYKNTKNSPFKQKDIKGLFQEFNLVSPSHFSEHFESFTKGKVPLLVKKTNGYVVHPSLDKDLTLEFFSAEKAENFKKEKNTSLFSKYDFHPAIKKVSFRQFQDGYYKEAILNALVEVVDQVKIKSGHPKNNSGKELDGDDLMNQVFGCDNQQPIVSFNDLATSLDKAEQRGIMYLFKGIVGVRDKKAHLNFIQNDPLKTIEYLSLASLLMRLLDENLAES